ncbi:hypothetical protein TNCV_2229271 [Trichonephila clavipes]|nr:hypothetical protein TNCV_2229271 [Trichonephila clavipes]
MNVLNVIRQKRERAFFEIVPAMPKTCSTITSQKIYDGAHTILRLAMRPSMLFLKSVVTLYPPLGKDQQNDLSAVQKGMIIGFWAKGGNISEMAKFVNCLRSEMHVAVSGPLKQTPVSCTYADCCSSSTKAGIFTLVSQLDIHRVATGSIFQRIAFYAPSDC